MAERFCLKQVRTWVREMKVYKPELPLIVIHIPKAGGTSSSNVFKKWFGSGFIPHYYNDQTGAPPVKLDLQSTIYKQNNVIIHGHFNSLRKMGIIDYYPNVKQFITILRDPFELTISNYFYVRKNKKNRKDSLLITDKSITDFLTNRNVNMLNHFPREVTMSNYKDLIEEFFIEIGVTEYLSESMRRIGLKLGMSYNSKILEHLNTTDRDQDVLQSLRDDFIENNQLEFIVYNYILDKYR